MDIKELQQKRDKLSHDIFKQISSLIKEFYNETGVGVDDIRISIDPLIEVGKEEHEFERIVSHVDVDIKI